MAKETFYKRDLPSPPAFAFSSTQGREIFQEALIQGTMGSFFKLMEQFSTQADPAFCGLGSLSMVLNALAVDPGRTWKGVWRWFDDQMLDCCKPLDTVRQEGLSLIQAACLGRCNGALVNMRQWGTFTEDGFREEVIRICSQDDRYMVVNYSRRALQQTGDGHFSPVGGYHRDRDLVLILDVARFKYPPHWVPLTLLVEAMSDAMGSSHRGFLTLGCKPPSKIPNPDDSSSHLSMGPNLFCLDITSNCWEQIHRSVKSLPSVFCQLLMQEEAKTGSGVTSLDVADTTPHLEAPLTIASVVHHMVKRLSESLILNCNQPFVVVRCQSVETGPSPSVETGPSPSVETGPSPSCLNCSTEGGSPHSHYAGLLEEMRALPLHKHVLAALKMMPEWISCNDKLLGERVTVMMLLLPATAYKTVSYSHVEFFEQWQHLLDLSRFRTLEYEISSLQVQFEQLNQLDEPSGDKSVL